MLETNLQLKCIKTSSRPSDDMNACACIDITMNIQSTSSYYLKAGKSVCK